MKMENGAIPSYSNGRVNKTSYSGMRHNYGY